MSTPSKSKSEYLSIFLPKIRTQYNETLNFEDTHISELVMQFKDQQHQNTFDEIYDKWEEYREDNGCEEETLEMEPTDDLPALPEETKEKSTDEPATVEERILERHIREMLYNILLAAHYQMKKRKDKLIDQLITNNKKEIISKYLPTNNKTMKPIIDHIFEQIVQKHYHKSQIFINPNYECKQLIIQYIVDSCQLSFKMLMAYNELSFFPLLFTDQSSSYIAPVVRYDRVIKKSEKQKDKKSKSLDQNAFLQLIKQHKAKKEYIEGQVNRDRGAVDSERILYYTFPGVIMKTSESHKDKILKKATVFTYHDPIIFLRHDLNWIFTDKLFRKQKMNKWVKDKSFHENEEELNPFIPATNDSDPYYNIQTQGKINKKMQMTMDKIIATNDVIQNNDFLGKAQLIQGWASLKKQKHSQLCEELCELIMDNDYDDDDDDDDSKDEEEDEEYEYNKLASKILFELMMKSRDAMKLKLKSSNIANNLHTTSYLNMYNIYKYFTNFKDNNDNNKVKQKDFKHGYIVQSIVNSTFEQVIDKKKYKQYIFLKTNKKLLQLLHEYIAKCCELICNIFHHEWDICPIKLSNKKKSLQIFDERIHIKEDDLSMEDFKNKIGYCCFPGIITKSCWNQFDIQYGKNKLNDKQIEQFIKSKMWVALIK